MLHALHRRGWIERARIVVMRRGTDPWESDDTGMINTVIPETRVPSHQGPDARKVLPDVDLTTMAAAGPFNLSHIHFAMVETTRPVSVAELRDAFFDEPRVALIRATDGLVALNTVVELMRDLDRPRGDMWEVALWVDAFAADTREAYLTYKIHNEAIVVPENIDAMGPRRPTRRCRLHRSHQPLARDHHGIPTHHRTAHRACDRRDRRPSGYGSSTDASRRIHRRRVQRSRRTHQR